METINNYRARASETTSTQGPDGTTPLVSVVIPYLGHPDLLPQAVSSVALQTYGNCEIVVTVNGAGAPPLTASLPPEVCERIRIIESEGSGSIGLRNSALQHSKGDLIFPLEPDHLLAPTCVEAVVHKFREDSTLAALCTDVKVVGERGRIYRAELTSVPVLARPEIPRAMVFQRRVYESIGGYRPEFQPCESAEFLLRTMKHGFHLKRLEEPLYIARESDNIAAESDGAEKQIEAVLMLLNTYLGLLPQDVYDFMSMREKDHLKEMSALNARLKQVAAERDGMRQKYEEVTNSYAVLLKHHNDALASVRVTFTHFLRALARKR